MHAAGMCWEYQEVKHWISITCLCFHPLSSLCRRPGGGRVLQHHSAHQADQGEDRGAGLQSHAGKHTTRSVLLTEIEQPGNMFSRCKPLYKYSTAPSSHLSRGLSAWPFSYCLFVSDFTLLCLSIESAATHQALPALFSLSALYNLAGLPNSLPPSLRSLLYSTACSPGVKRVAGMGKRFCEMQ